ncbi:hypothetical protein TRVA0_040S01398 [Trichomonascus vanleenenianus]|uniref:transcription activator GCR1-like domain-containing protein n=1 Tax=Trichomonascus vanleenenianus TaxID=2268995 RepID=UPI003EC97ECD
MSEGDESRTNHQRDLGQMFSILQARYHVIEDRLNSYHRGLEEQKRNTERLEKKVDQVLREVQKQSSLGQAQHNQIKTIADYIATELKPGNGFRSDHAVGSNNSVMGNSQNGATSGGSANAIPDSTMMAMPSRRRNSVISSSTGTMAPSHALVLPVGTDENTDSTQQPQHTTSAAQTTQLVLASGDSEIRRRMSASGSASSSAIQNGRKNSAGMPIRWAGENTNIVADDDKWKDYSFDGFEMERRNRTVHDLWNEWYYGVRGKPPIALMDKRFGPAWRRDCAKFYQRRKLLVVEIHRTAAALNISEAEAVDRAEWYRTHKSPIGNKGPLSLHQLYILITNARKQNRLLFLAE